MNDPSASDDNRAHDAPPLDPRLEATVERVTNALCDETATSEDLALLEGSLRGDRAAVRHYVEVAGIHSAIDWRVTSKPPRRDSDPAILAADASGQGGSVLRTRHSKGSLGSAFLAICVGLLIAIWYGGWTAPSEPGPDLVAGGECATIVTHSEDARWVVLRSSETPEMRTTLAAFETIHLTSGELSMRFEDGAEVMLTSPAVFQVLARDRALAMRGRLTAKVSEDAIGFSIDTPRAHVVDLGTRFGLEVDDLGQTDVIVFEGEVDIAYGPVEAEGPDWTRRVMRMGEAVRVDDRGDANRIVSIESDRFAALPAAQTLTQPRRRKPIISRVRDNIRDNESWNYYEIVHGGTERKTHWRTLIAKSHQWNGVHASRACRRISLAPIT